MEVSMDLTNITKLDNQLVITKLVRGLNGLQVSSSTEGSLIPDAPLVTAVYENGDDTIKIRILCFETNGTATDITPTVGVDKMNNNFYIQFAGKWDATMPKTAWYFEFEYKNIGVVYVNVFSNFIDPKTSRGTVTSVQAAEPRLV